MSDHPPMSQEECEEMRHRIQGWVTIQLSGLRNIMNSAESERERTIWGGAQRVAVAQLAAVAFRQAGYNREQYLEAVGRAWDKVEVIEVTEPPAEA